MSRRERRAAVLVLAAFLLGAVVALSMGKPPNTVILWGLAAAAAVGFRVAGRF